MEIINSQQALKSVIIFGDSPKKHDFCCLGQRIAEKQLERGFFIGDLLASLIDTQKIITDCEWSK